MKLTVMTKQEVPVRYLLAKCGVRYWEDGTVDGVEDEDGSRIPCREGDYWCPLIDLETGKIENWKTGVTAELHYKVCDDGVYTLLDAERNQVLRIDDYVPNIMSPKDSGYGDYVIMDINADGVIQNWKPDLKSFVPDET